MRGKYSHVPDFATLCNNAPPYRRILALPLPPNQPALSKSVARLRPEAPGRLKKAKFSADVDETNFSI